MIDSGGMIDISGKDVTVRTAKANGSIVLDTEAFQTVKQGTCIKGNVLTTEKDVWSNLD